MEHKWEREEEKWKTQLITHIFINAIEFHFEEDDDQNKEREK